MMYKRGMEVSNTDTHTVLTFVVNRAKARIILKVILVVGIIFMLGCMIFDETSNNSVPWIGAHTPEDSLVRRKLLDMNISDTSVTHSTGTVKNDIKIPDRNSDMINEKTENITNNSAYNRTLEFDIQKSESPNKKEYTSKRQQNVISKANLLNLLKGKNDITSCLDIFDGNSSIPWGENQKRLNATFFRHIKEKVLVDNLRIEGFSAKYPDQYKLYYQIAKLDFIKTVCETGFNIGHSAFMWLNTNPSVKVYSFDIAIHNYTIPMAHVLQSMFPGRLDIRFGDSRITLPTFHKNNYQITCDLVVVDGGHHENIPKKDLENFRLMASRQNNLIILDDWPGLPDVNATIGNMWRENIVNGKVEELFQCMKHKSYWQNGITLGQYI